MARSGMKRHRARLRSLIAGPVAAAAACWRSPRRGPAVSRRRLRPTNLTARDKPWDCGRARSILDWDPSPDDPALVDSYVIYRSMSSASRRRDHDARSRRSRRDGSGVRALATGLGPKLADLSDDDRDACACAAAGRGQASAAASEAVPGAGGLASSSWRACRPDSVGHDDRTEPDEPYSFKVDAMAPIGAIGRPR